MANSVITSKMTQVLSIAMAKNAGFLKIGSKDYFSDQINGKMRAGQSYDFVLPDAGQVATGLTINPRDITEKKVTLTIENYNNSVQADALELVTDIKWEEEIAEQYATKLMNKIIKDAVEDAETKVNAAFVGTGFAPLAQAGAFIQSISDADVYGFCDPQMQAILAANGQQFVPNGAPGDLYGKGKLGVFQGVEYKAERFLKPVTVGSLASDATVSSYTAPQGSAKYGTLAVSKALGAMKKGTPIWVNGVYACDGVGDSTNTLKAFIVYEDVSSNATSIKVEPIESTDIGARSVSKAPANGDSVLVPAAGTYYRALVRADGAYCYSPVNSMEFKLSDNMTAGDTDGIKVFANAFTNGTNAVNTVRWDSPMLKGVVEPRLCAVAYVKA